MMMLLSDVRRTMKVNRLSKDDITVCIIIIARVSAAKPWPGVHTIARWTGALEWGWTIRMRSEYLVLSSPY